MSPRAARRLEGIGSQARLGALQRRFRKASGRGGRRAVRALFAVYWTACLATIGFGLDRLRPEVRHGIVEGLASWSREGPFPNCAAAHVAGVYDIPSGSLAYTVRQDRDRDGLACEHLPR